MKIIYAVVAVGIIGVIAGVIIFNRSSYLASTMRLIRAEGDVKIMASGGGSKPATKNKRFESGDSLATGVTNSLASVSLDDTKIVTLQADSKADFIKKNKQIELKLTKGALFFEVTQKLNADETFEIKTSTLTAGIRGTSGYIYYDDQGRDSLTVTDGTVIVTAVNPDTGERKYAEIHGGQRITVILYSDRDTDSIEFEIEDLKEEDLNNFTLKMLVENDKLLDKVCKETGWDKQKLKDLLNSIINGQIEGTEVSPTPTEDTTEPTDTSESETETEKQTENTSESATPTPEEKKSKATNTPKPKATNTPKPKATNTTKPKNTTKPTSGSSNSSGSSETQGSSSNSSSGG
ncbi:MAG: FecR domain-containing protein, partial [Clostridiales bacterium]|nr:FecR domain-containing protein [Clostridiales bacterium]